MKVKVIASGSKGNCTLIRTDKLNLLIDMGITYQVLANELEKISLSPKELNAILITHSHNDHTKGLASLVKKTNIKVYILDSMLEELGSKIPNDNINFYEDSFYIEDLKVEIFRISHDVEGVGFILENNGRNLVYVTDTGYINENYFPKLKNKNLYIIESNHDEEMVMEGPYPYILKQRVLSDKGHLSNITTAGYLQELVGNNTEKIILAHISENNNTEQLALNTTLDALQEKNINLPVELAKQYESLEEVEV